MQIGYRDAGTRATYIPITSSVHILVVDPLGYFPVVDRHPQSTESWEKPAKLPEERVINAKERDTERREIVGRPDSLELRQYMDRFTHVDGKMGEGR